MATDQTMGQFDVLRKQVTALFQMVEWGGSSCGQPCCPSCLGFAGPPPGDLTQYGVQQGHSSCCRLVGKYQATLELLSELEKKELERTWD